MRSSMYRTPKLRVQPGQPQSQGQEPGRLETWIHDICMLKNLTSYLCIQVHGKGLHVVDIHIFAALHGMAVTYKHTISKS